jgi:hypothetical protein
MLVPNDRVSHVAGICADPVIAVEGRLETEILVLRHQLNILQRKSAEISAYEL